MRKTGVLAPLLVLAVPLFAQTASDNPAANYRSGTALLKKPVQMPRAVSLLCRQLSAEEQARLNQVMLGPHANKYTQVYVNVLGKATVERQRQTKEAYEKARFSGSYSQAKEKRLDTHFWGNPSRYPVGTVFTKEKFGNSKGEGIPELLTVMVKREKGYNSACFDWEFFVVEGSGKKVLEHGKLQRCQSCHLECKRTDGIATINVPVWNSGFAGFR